MLSQLSSIVGKLVRVLKNISIRFFIVSMVEWNGDS